MKDENDDRQRFSAGNKLMIKVVSIAVACIREKARRWRAGERERCIKFKF